MINYGRSEGVPNKMTSGYIYKSDIAPLFQTPHFEGSTWAFAATVLVFLVAIIWEAGERPQYPSSSWLLNVFIGVVDALMQERFSTRENIEHSEEDCGKQTGVKHRVFSWGLITCSSVCVEYV